MAKCWSLYEVIFNVLLFVIYIYFVVIQFWYSKWNVKSSWHIGKLHCDEM